jgi:antitoxin VapB
MIYTKGGIVRKIKPAKKQARKPRKALVSHDLEMPTAKIFQNGRSQAVRLPKDYRFEGTEIGIGRVGNAVLLYPLSDPWAVFFEGAKELSDLPVLDRHQSQERNLED